MTTQHPGSEIAGYRIESLIGRGGMAVVYRAEDTRLGRKVALKLLSPELADDDLFRRRFILESRLAASLDHPNIVPIYEAGDADGQLFIAMRYVVGRDLKAVLTEEGGPLPDEHTVSLIGQVGQALDAAHEAGLVHRDVKPGNILVAGDGEHPRPARGGHVYLADFGLTKRTTEMSAGLTGTGHFLGTADYVAPEQIQGKPLGPATDVYALGCVLFECLTGQLPFPRDDDAALLWAHLTELPPPIAAIRPDLDEGVGAVVARAMAKDPADRYASCQDLLRDLERSLSAPAASSPRVPRSRAGGTAWRLPSVPPGGSLAGPGTVADVPAGRSRDASATPAVSPVAREAAGGSPPPVEPPRASGERSPAALAPDDRPSPVPAAGPRRSRRRLVSRLLVVVALVLAGGAGAVVTNLLSPVAATPVVAEPAASPAPDPFTPPPASADTVPGTTSVPVSPPTGAGPAVPSGAGGGQAAAGPEVAVSGGTVGLYGGTGGRTCDAGAVAAFLDSHPDRAAAWAQAEGIRTSDIRPFLASLTPVVLRTDTAVTNHGFRNGRANAFESVLQAGTAVLVDEHGVPRVRCACGNPLAGPTARQHVRYTGQTWPELQRRPVTVIRQSTVVIQQFVLVVVQQDTTVVLDRPRGSAGDHDRPAPPQVVDQALSFSVGTPAAAGRTDGGTPGAGPSADTGVTPPTTPSTSTTPSTPTTTPPTTPTTSTSGTSTSGTSTSGTSSGSTGPGTSSTPSDGVPPPAVNPDSSSTSSSSVPPTGGTGAGSSSGSSSGGSSTGGTVPDGSSGSSGTGWTTGGTGPGSSGPGTGTGPVGGVAPPPAPAVVPQPAPGTDTAPPAPSS